MAYQFAARKYVNNTLVSIETVRVPMVRPNITNYNWWNSDDPDVIYSKFTTYIGDSGFDLFGRNHFLNGMSEPETLYGGPGIWKDVWNNALSNQVIRYDIITTDGIQRSIRVTPTVTDNNYPTSETYQLHVEFLVGDTVIIDLNGINTLCGRSYYTNEHIASWGTLPWICTDGDTMGWVGCVESIKIQGSPDNPYEKYCFTVKTVTRSGLGQDFTRWLNGWQPEEVIDPDNPYSGGGVTGETGDTPGTDGLPGNFSDDSDLPTTDELPSISAVDTGFATIFKPSRAQLRALSGLFWNSNVFTFLQNLVENITDMFVSLAMVPFNVTAGATVSVTWLGIDTAISLTLAAQQYYEFDMGTIDMSSDGRIFTSGSALDYSPFSQLGIYLPFIGYRELDIDECRGASINLRYRIDILSGACVAIIRVGGRDIYEFTGNCLTQIPITNENMQSLVTDAINVGIAMVGSQAAASAASADMAAAEGASTSEIAEAKKAHAQAHLTQSRGQLASSTANAAMGMKPTFAKTGNVSGADAMLAVKQPYLFLRTPRQAIPAHYQRYCGFPSNITGRLGEFSGYTVVEDIRLNGLVATSPEVAEIYDLLKKGVII